MNVDKIKMELLNLFTNENVLIYASKDSEDKNAHSIKCKLFNEYYLLISQNNVFSYAFELKNKLSKRIKDLDTKYKELLDLYNKNKNDELIMDINNYYNQIDALKIIYKVFEKYLNAKNEDLLEFSDNIVNLIKEINNEKNNDKKCILEEKLYKLRDERRVKISNSISDLTKIYELESIEIRLALKEDKEEYIVSKKEYLNSLKDSIEAINEYHYLRYKKSKFFKGTDEENNKLYDKYISKYYSLISSLFNDNFHVIEINNTKMSSDELINYLFIYNLDGNYELFRNKNKNKIIGNKEINKSKYLKQVELLNNSIIKLIDDCTKKFKTNNITIKDTNNINKLMELRNKKISEIDNEIGKE